MKTTERPRLARPAPHLHSAFGEDSFGRAAERAATFFGTPQYIVGQSLLVVVWIALNAVALVSHWDPYPFILLNLAFSTQAAYAAPLILLAQTRQAERDKQHAILVEGHQRAEEERAEGMMHELRTLLRSNTDLTEEAVRLNRQVAALLQARDAG